MAEFKVKTDEKGWLAVMREKAGQVTDAASGALRDTAGKALTDARTHIQTIFKEREHAGSLIVNLKEGLRLFFKGETGEVRPRAIIFHRSTLAAKFEHGGTIAGKPLLWIPTTRRAPPARQSGKKLISATVRGRPMLFDAADHDRHRRPLYIGVARVRVPKLTNITGIVKDHVARIADLFRARFKGD